MKLEYPELQSIANLYPGPQVLLGHRLFWTEKRDGSQLRIWWDGDKLQVWTRHMEASAQFRAYFDDTPQASAVISLVQGEGVVQGVSDFGSYVVFGELLVKGKSPARYETHAENEFVVFDLMEMATGTWMPIPAAYQHCLHYNVPFVEVYGESSHTTLEGLFSFRDEMLALATERGREGVVVKTLVKGRSVYAKEKRDALPVIKTSLSDGSVKLPPLPDGEATGAIAKAHADLGEKFFDKAQGMPLVAKYIAEECFKHLCGKPLYPLFHYYQQYIQDRLTS